MTTAVLLLLTTGLIWGCVGILFGKAPSEKDKLFTWFALNGIFVTTLVWMTRTPDPAPVKEVLRLAFYIAPSAVLEILAFLLLKLAMNRGSQGVAWCVMQSAMLVPFLGSLIFLGNRASLWQWLGMGLITASLILFGISKHASSQNKHADPLFFRYVLLSFALIGAAQFLRIIPGSAGFSSETLSWRLPIQAPFGMIFWLSVCLKNRLFCPRKVWKQALFYGIVVTMGQVAFYLATDASDKLKLTSIIYPVAMGTCIAFFSLYCALVRKEQVSLLEWSAITSTITGIALMAVC